MRALISVADKSGLVPFVEALHALGCTIISTGGTAATLRNAAIPVTDIADSTGVPEMLDGRVKTLHPAIHGAILAVRANPEHMAQLASQQISPIDLVICNLYDFAGTLAQHDATDTDIIEHIDIGGVALLRAAAKNHADVTVVFDPADYPVILAELQEQGRTTDATRRRLAAKAFAHTAAYDGLISQYLLDQADEGFPQEAALPLQQTQALRYGENPHQQAALYRVVTHTHPEARPANLVDAEILHGKQLGYNNYIDLDAALDIVADFVTPAVAIVKHAGPCGIATHADLVTAYRQALASDPVSAFGGIIGCNRVVDIQTAQAISESHYDAIVAPEYTPEALSLLEKKKKLILVATHRPIGPAMETGLLATAAYRQIRGGVLLQTPNRLLDENIEMRTVTERIPTATERSALHFAWKTVKHVKSNAIVLAVDGATVGIGGGQPNRVDSVRIAAQRAGDRAKGSVLASDAYLPFADNVAVAVAAGVTAIIQPGGSIRDSEVIAAANEQGLAMVFTGVRVFRH